MQQAADEMKAPDPQERRKTIRRVCQLLRTSITAVPSIGSYYNTCASATVATQLPIHLSQRMHLQQSVSRFTLIGPLYTTAMHFKVCPELLLFFVEKYVNKILV